MGIGEEKGNNPNKGIYCFLSTYFCQPGKWLGRSRTVVPALARKTELTLGLDLFGHRKEFQGRWVVKKKFIWRCWWRGREKIMSNILKREQTWAPPKVERAPYTTQHKGRKVHLKRGDAGHMCSLRYKVPRRHLFTLLCSKLAFIGFSQSAPTWGFLSR